MGAMETPRPVVGLFLAGRADRGVLASFFGEVGHDVLAVEPGSGADLSTLGRASVIIVDEPVARMHADALLALKARAVPVVMPILVAVAPNADGADVLQRGFDEVLRMPIAKHDLLARIETCMRLRRQSEDALRDSEAFSRATLDAIAANICVVNAQGRITLVNRAWREFAEANGGLPGAVCEGASYLEACRAAAADGADPESRQADAAILSVLDGRATSATVEYGCHAPAERRWFIASAVRFGNTNAPFTVVTHTNITARRESELAAQAAEHRFRSLVELSSDFYWETDREHRLTVRSEGAAGSSLAALGGGAVLGKTRWELPHVNPGPEGWQAHRADLDARRPFRDFQFARPGSDGFAYYFSVSGEPFYAATGEFAGYRGVGSDITERKRAERLLAMEHAVTRCLSDAKGESAGLRDAIRIVCEAKGWDCGRFWRLDEASGVLRAADSWTVPEARIQAYLASSQDLVVAPGEGVMGEVLESAEPQWLSDPASDARTLRPDLVRAAGLRAACIVPIVADGRRLGVLSFLGQVVRRPDERLVGALRAIGEQLGQYLQRVRSELELRQTNRKLEMQALRRARIARFGQFALKRRGSDELVAAAVAELADLADATTMFERTTDGEIALRFAHGAGTEEHIGRSAPLRADSAAHRVLEGGSAILVPAEQLEATPDEWPWANWMRQMRSGMLVPVTHNGHAHGMLGIFARRAGAIGEEEASFAGAIATMLSTALQREHAEERLAFLAQFDSLTGLPNRGLLEDRLRQAAAQSTRQGSQTALLFIDLDRFKLVNDTFDHTAGDLMLQEVGRRLEKSVRAGDTVARVSGDEFALVLANILRAEDAGTVAQKVLDEIARPFDLGGREAFVSASIGISIHPGDGTDVGTVLRNADLAMYKAKRAARGTYRFFTASMNERAVATMEMSADLRHATERREFLLHYQPKVDLRSGLIAGVEALLRWNHPRRGLVSPAEFIPALENSGLILPVGEWVLQEACAQIRRWQSGGLAVVPVAVNLSVKQFRRPNLDGIVRRILEEAAVPASLIGLEITESGFADDPEDAVRQMRNLRDAGITISLDDFGTGYSSLAYLSNLPLAALKIDRSFIVRMLEDPNSATLVKSIVSLAHSLSLKVVAEGVETEEQARFLRLLRCDQMQGYLFSKPLPAEALAQLLDPVRSAAAG
jgi:diguanylate cyclase (GGDEF)-like protein/PAS domain S-box-containing protein